MPAFIPPADHPLRYALAEEVHARPPAPVVAPAVVSFLALTDAPAQQVAAALLKLGDENDASARDAPHGIVRFSGVVAKWEVHTEFLSLVFVRPLAGHVLDRTEESFPTAFAALPAGWLQQLPGHTIAAGDVLVVPSSGKIPDTRMLAPWFDPDALAGAAVSGGAAWLFTDFRVKYGRTRWVLVDAKMGRLQTARNVQRLIEIDIYRMTALLGFPLARATFPELTRIERELERITAVTAALQTGGAAHDEERTLLQQLSRVAAEVERLNAANAFRFGASQAYWDIVRARIAELREERLEDLRTLGGFLSRRLAPAMESCAAAARRLEQLSARVERASALLRTRVDVAREEQNQQVLAAMERRGKLQLRLQQTVESLSIVAIAYYAAGLLTYLLKPFETLGRVPVGWIVAASVPVTAIVVLVGLRRFRRKLSLE